ncbi:hypothetical protein [uncultured Serinicoccus sp.]|uniref:hypothetical protein n=1 Tax=uncultured Serinicoccus sp. TaxID=735514 RepID=UPI002602EA4A|nr:hypothetical protein [uncultured Serinicoccus sp.]
MSGTRPAGSSSAGGPSAVRTVDTEVDRLGRRWQQLPLDRALTAYPGVRGVVQELADAVADRTGQRRATVPDLGPGVVVDQLRVMVYDWRQADLPEADLAGRLTILRRGLP